MQIDDIGEDIEKASPGAALQESEQRFRRMVEQSPLSIQILSPDGSTLQVNPAWERLWGVTLEQMAGYNILEDEQLEEKGILPFIKRAYQGETCHIPALPYSPDRGIFAGQDRWSRAFIYPVIVNGEIRQVVLVHEDITEQKAAEHALFDSEQKHRAIFENAQDAILLADDDGRYRDANPAAETLTGYTKAELLSFSVADLTPKDQLSSLESDWNSFKGLDVQSGEYVLQAKQGHFVTVEYRAVANVLPGLHLSILRDVSERSAADAALRASEIRFRELADSMPAIVWSSHADGRTDYLNRHYYDYTGLSRDIPGTDGWELVVHPDDMASARTRYMDCFSRGVTWEQELRLKSKDGIYRWHLSRSVPVLAEGKPVRWYATSTDIHDQKLAEDKAKEEAFALETINRVGQSLSSELDLDRLVQSLTDAATQLVGAEFGSFFYNVQSDAGESYLLYTLSGLPKSAFEKFPMPRNTEVFNPTFQGESVVRSDDITRDPRYGKSEPHFGMPEGHPPVKSYLAVPVISRGGQVIGGLFFGHSENGVFFERHERILLGIASQAAVAIDNAMLYQRLTAMNVDLEKRVMTRTAELEAANKEMEGFTYSISHDLRSPLRAIVSNSMILKHEYGASLPADAAEHLERQAAAANKMASLIDDLLRLSRLGRQDMARVNTDLSEMAKDVFDEFVDSKGGAPVVLQAEDSLFAKVDPKLFRLVLVNLIDNALKFSPDGGRIEFGKLVTDRGETFFVRDYGIGFDQKYAPKLFLPFERLVLDRDFPGTGIGLANVKRIVERHGGTVWAEGELGKGASFYFTVPG